MGEPHTVFLLSLALADPEQSAKGLQMDTMEICQICFGSYISAYAKDHQCPDDWSCGACGEICEIEDGTVSMNSGLLEFTHKAELCSAQDEVFKYEGKIRFTTDKELTERELQQLIFAIEVQIEEPTDSNGDDEEFTTSTVLVELEAK
jgi:hypothetical protein